MGMPIEIVAMYFACSTAWMSARFNACFGSGDRPLPAIRSGMCRCMALQCMTMVQMKHYSPACAERFAIVSSGSVTAPEVKLAITLRWLARGGGAYLDVAACFGIDAATLLVHVWPISDIINEVLHIEFPLQDPEQLRALERGFYATSANRKP